MIDVVGAIRKTIVIEVFEMMWDIEVVGMAEVMWLNGAIKALRMNGVTKTVEAIGALDFIEVVGAAGAISWLEYYKRYFNVQNHNNDSRPYHEHDRDEI